MGKDFRVGLMTGVVLAGAALIWVATRPSLSPRARLPRPAAAGTEQESAPSSAGQAVNRPLPWEALQPADANRRDESPLASAPATSTTSGPQEVNEPARGAPPGTGQAGSDGTQATDREAPQLGSHAPAEAPLVTRSAWPDQTIYERSEPIKTTRFHIVRKGDTLSSIAAQYLGSANQWRKIVETNAKIIKNPDKISPGTKLIIPD